MISSKENDKISYKFKRANALCISLLILCGILFIILLTKFYSNSKESIISNEYITIESTAKKVEYVLQTYIDQIYECKAMIDEMVASGKNNEDILNYLVMEHDAIYLVAGEQYIDIYGYIRGEHLDGAKWEPPADYIPTERPWYLAATADKGNISMAGPYVDAMTGSTVISYAITLAGGTGVVSYDVLLDDLQTIISDFAGSKYERALLVSDEDKIIIDSSKEYGCMAVNEIDNPFIQAVYNGYNSNHSQNFTFDFEGDSYYVYNMDVSFNMHYLVIGNTKAMFPNLKYIALLAILLLIGFVVIEGFLLHNANAHRRQIEKDLLQIQTLYHDANTDKLTGLSNRRAYEDFIEEAKDKGLDDNFVYIVFDVNGLKQVNDTFGHDSGDTYIKETALLLESVYKQYGQVFRTGGDEFVVLASMTEDEVAEARSLLSHEIREHNKDSQFNTSVSYGCSSKNKNPQAAIDELAKMADKEMYKQKAMYYSASGVDRRKKGNPQ